MLLLRVVLLVLLLLLLTVLLVLFVAVHRLHGLLHGRLHGLLHGLWIAPLVGTRHRRRALRVVRSGCRRRGSKYGTGGLGLILSLLLCH